MNPVLHRLAAGAQRAGGAGGQHGSIDFHFLIKGADFNGGDGGVVGVQAQGEGHVTEDVLRPQVNAFGRVRYQLYVAYGGVACDKGTQADRRGQQTVVLIKDYDRYVFLLSKKCNNGLIHVVHLIQAFTDGE